LSLPLQAVQDQATDQNFRQISQHWYDLPPFLELSELPEAPSAPGANKVRIYAVDNGAGKTQAVARFHTGAVQVLATEP
jgi:hypothetical protein